MPCKKGNILVSLLIAIPLIAGLLVVAGMAGLSVTSIQEYISSEPTSTKIVGTQVVAASSSIPARLIIPKLSINAAVQSVGVTRSGDMATPSGTNKYKDVAWYKYGAGLGAPGNIVMAGHFDNGFGRTAVFRHLRDLQKGDEITVMNPDGKEYKYIVVRTAEYNPATAPRKEVFSMSGPPRLVLITCEGEWIPEKKMYTGRYVVYADIVASNL